MSRWCNSVLPKARYSTEAYAPPSSHKGLFYAYRLVRNFGDKVPTVPQLMAEFGMSRATAFRWIAAIKAARGEA